MTKKYSQFSIKCEGFCRIFYKPKSGIISKNLSRLTVDNLKKNKRPILEFGQVFMDLLTRLKSGE